MKSTGKSGGLRASSNSAEEIEHEEVLRVLVVIRKETENEWGSLRTSRLITNEADVVQSLRVALRVGETANDSHEQALAVVGGEQVHRLSKRLRVRIEVMARDLTAMPFPDQIRLIAQSGVIIGVHGAGVASTMHMSIGTSHCCGVLEIFPLGEFSPVRGHGNMARKMGLYYDRIDVNASSSMATGTMVPIGNLTRAVVGLVERIESQASCVLRDVIDDPWFEKTQ